MFRIVFLGTSGAVPSSERSLPAIAMQRDGSVYLFDCGEGTQRQMMRFNVSYEKVKAVFLTHLHLDHVIGLFGLLETLKLKKRAGLKIFGPPGTSALISPFAKEAGRAEIKEITGEEKIFETDDFSVSSFCTEHGLRHSFGYIIQEKEKIRFNAEKAHSLGMKGEMFREIQEKGKIKVEGKTIKLSEVACAVPGKKIIYSGDTKAFAGMAKIAKEADLLIHEGTYGNDREKEANERFHTSAVSAAKIAKKAKVKSLILTHISSRYPKAEVLEEEAKKVFANSRVAYDGMEISV